MQPLPVNPFIFFLIVLWVTFWKGLALWKSAQNKQRNWFITILVLNGATAGLLEIAYLFYFSRDKLKLDEITSTVKGLFTNRMKKK